MLSALQRRPRESRDTLYLLGLIVLIAMPQLTRLPVWCVVLMAAVLLWRAWLAWTVRPLPARRWAVLLLVAALVATWWQYRTLLGREPGVTMVFVLLCLKTLELRQRRDGFVLFFLGFFALLTHFLVSQSLVVAALMLVSLLGLLTALVNAQRPLGRPTLTSSARIASGLMLVGSPVMMVLFLLFPRVGPLWGLPSDAAGARSGLSSSMEVGNIAKLALDDSVALRVRFEGPVPAPDTLYFRGPVLSDFDGVLWQMRRLPQSATLPGLVVPLGSALRYQVTLEPGSQPWLPLLELSALAPSNDAGLTARATPELQWQTTRATGELLRYEARSHVDYRFQPELDDTQQRAYRALPQGSNPRTLQLAAQWRAEAPSATPEQWVAKVWQQLQSGGYRYTLEPGLFGRDSVDEFWFDKREGFCEHFSASFVVLMRALGVPARVVTGYQGGERNPIDGYWTVRQSDAHAWAEVWMPRRGWTRVDPTAAVAPARIGALQRLAAPRGALATALAGVTPDWGRGLRTLWEAINNQWNQSVLNYTQSRQMELLRGLGFDSPAWEDLLRVLAAVLVAASSMVAAWALWERRQHDPWLRMLRAARHKVRRAGYSVAHQATPRDLAQALLTNPPAPNADDAPPLDPLVRWLDALERVRYADLTSTTNNLATLQRQWRQLRWPSPH